MWEITITGKIETQNLLTDLKNVLVDKFVDCNFICVSEIVDNKFILSMCLNKSICEFQDDLRNLLSEKIVLYFKEKYFLNKIDFSSLSESCKMAFIKSMVAFEFDEDKNYVYSKIDINNNINFESFYKFKLKDLERKWSEIINVLSLETLGLNNYEIFLDFLKYLISDIKPKFSEIRVYFKNGRFILLDENGKKISENSSEFIKDEIGLVTDLIMFAPLKIKFYCKNISIDTQKLITYIFGGRVEKFIYGE